MSITLYPKFERLTDGLSYVFFGEKSANSKVTILDRKPNPYSSTDPSEIVTCRLSDGVQLRVMCKYGVESWDYYDARGGITYEAEVYRRVLYPIEISKVRCYGTYKDVSTDMVCLVLEYLDKSLRVKKASYPESIYLAANWLGQFHTLNETRLSTAPIAFLKKYDYEYYLGWAYRTLLLANELYQNFPWLKKLCKRWEEIIDELLLPPKTVIHGEFYSSNILIQDGIIYPIDWESAAIAVEEIDLAFITWDWPDEIVQQLETEYQKARWPGGMPNNFKKRLDAARLFQQFRWMGDRNVVSRSMKLKKISGWFEKLYLLGERLELL